MKVKRKRRMSRRRRERTYIAVMVLLAIAVSIGLTRSVMRDDKEFEEYEQQSQEFNARMQRIDEKREASGQNAMLEQVRTWQQEQDTEPDKYAVFDTMSADWGGEEDGFVFYEIPEEYSRTGGYFPEKMQVYTYCVCKQYGVRYDLVVALIEKESGYKFDKVGDDGHSMENNFQALKTTGILCSPIAEVDITAMGYVDGKLHIQVKYEDSLETDNHGYIYFKNDKGEEIHCIANIAFSTDSEHQERYVEYVYDLSDVDLTQYKVYGYFVTSDTHIEGNWSVTFPLESISQ